MNGVNNSMNERKIGIKNFIIYLIGEIILGILVPYGLIGLTYLITNKINSIVNPANIVLLLTIFVILLLDELIISKITIKITNNKFLIKRFALIFTVVKIMIYILRVLTIITPNDTDIAIIASSLIIIFRMSSYFIARKSITKH